MTKLLLAHYLIAKAPVLIPGFTVVKGERIRIHGLMPATKASRALIRLPAKMLLFNVSGRITRLHR